MTRNPGMLTLVSPNRSVRAPPKVHRTITNVMAESPACRTPAAKSTGDSVAIRRSSAMRYSGFWWSPRIRLSWKYLPWPSQRVVTSLSSQAPAALGGEPQLHCKAPHDDTGGGKNGKEQSGRQYRRPVVALQRIE